MFQIYVFIISFVTRNDTDASITDAKTLFAESSVSKLILVFNHSLLFSSLKMYLITFSIKSFFVSMASHTYNASKHNAVDSHWKPNYQRHFASMELFHLFVDKLKILHQLLLYQLFLFQNKYYSQCL